MDKAERMEKAINNVLSMLRAWADGKITVTTGSNDMEKSIYNINTITHIMENNLQEGITPPTQLIERGEHTYEILITVPEI